MIPKAYVAWTLLTAPNYSDTTPKSTLDRATPHPPSPSAAPPRSTSVLQVSANFHLPNRTLVGVLTALCSFLP